MVGVGMGGGEPHVEAPCTPIEMSLGEQLYHQRAESEKSANQIEHRGVVADDVTAIIVGG